MNPKLARAIEEWIRAGAIDAAAADRIRAFEAARHGARRGRWTVFLAVALGGMLLGAGVLLFVAAHWDRLSPAARFALVLLMVGAFHVAAALAAPRFSALATVLHAVGTVTLGAGIFMAGQIFHLQEHWPGGVMLWAAGAAIGWALLRDWSQAALVAILAPAWLAGEWLEATGDGARSAQILGQGLVLLAATYLSARTPARDTPARRALAWIGGLAIIPCVPVALEGGWSDKTLPAGISAAGWTIGLGLPLLLALLLRGRAAWMNLCAAAWAVGLGLIGGIGEAQARASDVLFFVDEFGGYLWCGLGAMALIAWGLREGRPERVNLGVAGFALTVMVFYFSNVMDKLGRATSLIGLGLLFLVGGWLLERARRRLIARLKETPA